MSLRRRVRAAWAVLTGKAWTVQPVDYFSVECKHRNGSSYMLTSGTPEQFHGHAMMEGKNCYEFFLAGPDESTYKIALWWHK